MATARTAAVKKGVSTLVRNFAFIYNYPVCLSLFVGAGYSAGGGFKKPAPAEYATNAFNS